jgi:hypothetical protein
VDQIEGVLLERLGGDISTGTITSGDIDEAIRITDDPGFSWLARRSSPPGAASLAGGPVRARIRSLRLPLHRVTRSYASRSRPRLPRASRAGTAIA